MSKAQTKKELAEAGRRKLEAFRRQKAGKTQASAGSVLSDPVSRPLQSTEAQRSNAEPVRLPAGSGNSLPGPPDPRRKLSYGNAPSHAAATLSAPAGNPEAPAPAEQHQQRTSEGSAALAAPEHGARVGQHSALQDDRSAERSGSSTLREAAVAGQGASQSLRSAVPPLPAPPPMPLPPAAFNSRPPWMNASAADSSSSSRMGSQQEPAQRPVTNGSMPFGPTDAARPVTGPLSVMATGGVRASLASSPAKDAGLASQGSVSSASRSEPANGNAASTASAEDVTSAAGSSTVAQPSAVQVEQRSDAPSAAKAAFSAAAEDQQRVEPSELGLGSTEESEDDSRQALLARPAPTRQPRNAPDLQQARQQSSWPRALSSPAANRSVDLPGSAAVSTQQQPQNPETREGPLQSYPHLSDEYLGHSESAAVNSNAPAISGGEHPADTLGGGAGVASGYAALSDSYLSPPRLGRGASGTAPIAIGSNQNAHEHQSSVPGSGAADRAALSSGYLPPPELSQRASGALPVSRSAASGPPSHSALDPVEQRQLGALPASNGSASPPPSWPALGLFERPQQGRPPQRPSSPLSRQSGQHSQHSGDIAQGPDAGSSASTRLHDVQHASAAPTGSAGNESNEGARRASYGSLGGNGAAFTRQGSPSRLWLGADGPPPSRYQRPPWMADDSEQGIRDRSTQPGSNSGPFAVSDGNGAAPERSHEDHSELQRGSATANGMPPSGPHRSSSREAGLTSASAAPSPPISVRGTASEEGFAASEGQMKRFKALQQHIDELTREKFDLIRGLQTQRKVQESLEAESERFTNDFNRQAQHVQELHRQVGQLSAEVAAQRLALAAAARERDGARASALETSERLTRMAAEVVDLEEKALKARSAELKGEREAAAEREAARRARSAAKAAQQERETLQSILDTLEEEKRALHVKLRRAALGEHLREERGSKEAATQTEPGPLEEAMSPMPFQPQLSAQTPRQRAESVLQTQSQEDPSVRLANEAFRAFNEQSLEGSKPAQLPDAVLQLLPKTLYRGGLAGKESDVAADEATALSNIHLLLDTLESQRHSMVASLTGKEAEVTKLAASNEDLAQRLESAQQRLELAISRSQHASAQPRPAPAAQETPASEQGPQPTSAREDNTGQLVVQSAPNTPAQPRRQLLRAPKGSSGDARKSTLGWFVDLLVPPSQDFQRIGPLT